MATVGIKLKGLNFTLKSHHKLGFCLAADHIIAVCTCLTKSTMQLNRQYYFTFITID